MLGIRKENFLPKKILEWSFSQVGEMVATDLQLKNLFPWK